MKLQLQNPSGDWSDVSQTRIEELLLRCEQNNGLQAGQIVPVFRADRPMTRAEVLEALSAGHQLRNRRSGDWYANCRDGEIADIRARAARELMAATPTKKCSCGHTVALAVVMTTSSGSSCADCYDRMEV